MPGPSRLVVAKFGQFYDKRYGDFEITPTMAEGWKKNLAEHFGGQVSIDLDHAPEVNGQTEAAGWIKGLEWDDEFVYAPVEWTSLGENAIRDKRYRYTSPSYKEHFVDEHGADLGNALVGVALTNRPVLRSGMPTVNLSHAQASGLKHGPAIQITRSYTLAECVDAAVGSRRLAAAPSFAAPPGGTGPAPAGGIADLGSALGEPIRDVLSNRTAAAPVISRVAEITGKPFQVVFEGMVNAAHRNRPGDTVGECLDRAFPGWRAAQADRDRATDAGVGNTKVVDPGRSRGGR